MSVTLSFPLPCRTVTMRPLFNRSRNFVHGRARLRHCGSFRRSSIGGRHGTQRQTPLQIPAPSTRRSHRLRLSRLQLPTPRAHTQRHQPNPGLSRWHHEPLQALDPKRRLPSRPAQRTPSLRFADLTARAIPPRMRRLRRLRRHRHRRRLPLLRLHPHPQPRTHLP